MDQFPLLQELILSFNEEELVHFASLHSILDEPIIQERVNYLKSFSNVENECDLERNIQRDLNSFDESDDLSYQFGGAPDDDDDDDDDDGSRSDDRVNEPAYFITKKKERVFKKSLAKDTTYEINFNSEWKGKKLSNISEKLHEMFDDVISQVPHSESDLGRVVIHNSGLSSPIVVPLQRWDGLDSDTIMSEVAKVMNSNEDLEVNDSMNISVGSIEMPKGGAKLSINNIFGQGSSIERKNSIFEISNDNNLCMVMAIIVCYFKTCSKVNAATWYHMTNNDKTLSMLEKVIKYKTVPDWYYKKALKKKHHAFVTELAVELCRKTNVPFSRFLSLNDIPPFEDVLEVNVMVVSSRLGNKFIRVVEQSSDRTNLFLYLVETDTEQHFHGIANIQGFFKQSYFCLSCLIPYSHKDSHICDVKCDVCLSDECLVSDSPVTCLSCKRKCRSIDCFERHKTKRQVKRGAKRYRSEDNLALQTECEKKYKCQHCSRVIKTVERSKEDHECGEMLCLNCNEYHIGSHLCYHRATQAKGKNNKKYIFYDFETRQDSIMQCENGYSPSKIRCRKCVKEVKKCAQCSLCKNCRQSTCGLNEHIVNFAVMQSLCPKCEDNPLLPDSKCEYCGKRCYKCRQYDVENNRFKQPPCVDTCGFRERVFKGDGAAEEFCANLISIECKNSIVMAHNSKSFDIFPILDVLILKHSIRPENIIFSGTKVMYMTIGRDINLTFLDSYNFLPMKLSKIPEAFGIENLCKGTFPHLFNVKQNEFYVGPFPQSKYYGIDSMKMKDRKDFLKWHATKENEIFDFQKEILAYCRDDVNILRKGCMKFREIMLDVTQNKSIEIDPTTRTETAHVSGGIDPFDQITLAGTTMKIFKSLFLQEEYQVDVTNTLTNEIHDCDMKYESGERKIFYDKRWVSEKDLIESSNLKLGKTKFVRSPIARIPSETYVRRDNFSKISILWMEMMMEKARRKQKPIFIQHALNKGEFNIPGTNYRVDGYQTKNADGTSCKKVFEFLGCNYHGCPVHFPNPDQSAKPIAETMGELYLLTKKREEKIRSMGYEYEEIWECQFKTMLENDREINDYLQTLDIVDRLDIRDAMYGGRVNCTKLHHKISQPGETIEYFDFTSLYSFCQKYRRFPVSHPTIITQDFDDISKYFGMVKLKILPCKKIFHAILPYRSHGKLTFPLCRTCADTENQSPCTHSDEERSFVGTFCTPEVEAAVQKGYKVLKIYEVYDFKESTQYDPSTGIGGLFSEYVNLFLRLKTEASGYPDNLVSMEQKHAFIEKHEKLTGVKIDIDKVETGDCITEEQKLDYIRTYKEREGIDLRYENIKKNPALRSLSKLCLNSFFGKWAQRPGFKQSTCFDESEADKFFRILSDRRKHLHNFHIVSKNTLLLEWSDSPLFLPTDNTTNVFLGAFTTMWARLRLYEILDKLQEDVLYFDTDSCIFVKNDQNAEKVASLPIGNFLGDLTNEISPKDGHIVEFVSTGPKSYSYRTQSGKEVCKVKGFSLNFANSRLINFESISNMIQAYRNKQKVTIPITQTKICRSAVKRKLYNREESKRFNLVYSKRRILMNGNLSTLPFGHE